MFFLHKYKSEKALRAISTSRCDSVVYCAWHPFPSVYYFIYLIFLSIVLYSGTDRFIIFLFKLNISDF